MRINISGGSNSVYYILKDHLGSASVVTDSTGTIVGEQRYYPYGETRFTSGTIYTDKLFTGQRDVGLGIYHYGARFYSPKTGRFLSPDSIVQNHTIPQFLNRYSYTLNNPVRYTDPTGHVLPCEQGDVCLHPDTNPPPGPTPCYTCDGGTHDDDDLRDPNPECIGCPGTETEVDEPPDLAPPEEPPLVAPPCSSSMCNPNLTGPWPPSSTQSTSQPFTTPGYSVPQFIGGAILFAGGLGFAGFGVALGFIALGEVTMGAATGPGEILIIPHALAMTAVGGIFFLGGLGIAYEGYLVMKDGLTP